MKHRKTGKHVLGQFNLKSSASITLILCTSPWIDVICHYILFFIRNGHMFSSYTWQLHSLNYVCPKLKLSYSGSRFWFTR